MLCQNSPLKYCQLVSLVNLSSCQLKVGSINAHRHINEYLRVNVLPSFGFFLGQIASRIGHVARYAHSTTFNLSSKTISKSDKAHL